MHKKTKNDLTQKYAKLVRKHSEILTFYVSYIHTKTTANDFDVQYRVVIDTGILNLTYNCFRKNNFDSPITMQYFNYDMSKPIIKHI